MRIRPALDRMEALLETLQEILDRKRLTPALSGKTYGKLMFLSSQSFGRLGRALLRAFSRRQHESRAALNQHIIAAFRFWLRCMKSLRFREIPVSLSEAPVILSYSDCEGDGAGVGVAVWCPNGTVSGGYLKLPEEVRSVWSRSASAGDHYDIFEIEAVGPALILYNFGHVSTQDALWLHFVDNDAARAAIVKGSSSVLSGEVITA